MAASVETGTAQSIGAALGAGAARDVIGRLNGTYTTLVVDTLLGTLGQFQTLNVTGTLTTAALTRANYQFGAGGRAKVGGSAGWTVGAANNLGTVATMAAGQTAGTLVIPIVGLQSASTITGFSVYASINSGGNAVTLDAELRKLVFAAGATATDSSVASMTQISVTAPTAANGGNQAFSSVVVAGTTYYLLLTGTTGAGCTIELLMPDIIVTTY